MLFSNDKWIRLYTTLMEVGQFVLLSILHKYLPKDGKLLYQQFNTVYKVKLTNLKKNKILRDDQWDLLFPLSKETDSSLFDTTLLIVLIQNCTTLPPPTGGWKIKRPLQGDVSIAAYILKLRILRNELTHNLLLHVMSKAEFDRRWIELENISIGIGYNTLQGALSFAEMKRRVIDRSNVAYVLAESRYNDFLTNVKYKIVLASSLILVAMLALLIHPMYIQYYIQKASVELKNYYNATLGQKLMQDSSVDKKRKQRFFVDLNVVDETVFNEMFKQPDINHHKEKHLQPPRGIKMQDILGDGEHKFVLIRGVGGMGKTHLSEQIILDWALNKHWKEFNFVFLFKCRELNHVTNIQSVEDMFRSKFPNVLNIIPFDYLVSNAPEILIILDGIDELVSFNKDEHNSLMNSFFELVNPKNEVLYKRKLIITGRPHSIAKFKRIQHHYSTRNIDITGFNEKSIKTFIEHYFHEKPKICKKVLSVVNMNDNMKLMARIPVYLNIMCSLHDVHEELVLKTVTELYVWQFALFVEAHIHASQSHKMKSISIDKVFRDPDVQLMISRLAQLSFDMLCEGKAVFKIDDTEKDIEMYDKMEEAGLVMHTTSITGEIRYQFYHLTMQEFFAAVHLCIKRVKYPSSRNVSLNFQDTSVFAFYAGLQGGLLHLSNSSYIIKQFARNLKFIYWINNYGFLEGMEPLKLPLFFQCYFEYQNKIDSTPFFWNVAFRFPKNIFLLGGYVQHPGINPEHFIYFLNEEPGMIEFLNYEQPVYLTFSKQLNYKQSLKLLENSLYISKVYIPAAGINVNAVQEFCESVRFNRHYLGNLTLHGGLPSKFKNISLTPWLPCLPFVHSFHLIASFKNSEQYTQTVLNICNSLTTEHLRTILLRFLSVLDYNVNELDYHRYSKFHMSYIVLQRLSRCLPLIERLDVRILSRNNLEETIFRHKNDKIFRYTTFTVHKYPLIEHVCDSISGKRNSKKNKRKRFWYKTYNDRNASSEQETNDVSKCIDRGRSCGYTMENLLYDKSDKMTLPKTMDPPESSPNDNLAIRNHAIRPYDKYPPGLLFDIMDKTTRHYKTFKINLLNL